MNPDKRFIISNTAAVIIPIIITIIMAFLYTFISPLFSGQHLSQENILRLAEQRYELFTSSNSILVKNPDMLLDKAFQEDLKSMLVYKKTGFTIRKNYKPMFSTLNIDEIELEKTLLKKDLKYQGNPVVINKTPYLIKEYPFVFKDGTPGSLILFTSVIKGESYLLQLLLFTGIVYIIAFGVTSLLLSKSFSKNVLIPLGRLKKAAGEISMGNLDYFVVEEGDSCIRELSRSFEQMRLKLKESVYNQMKLDGNRRLLVSGISHDLKTPITAIKGYVGGILDGVAHTPDKVEKYLKSVYAKTVQLDTMIDDLFLYSKLDLKQLPYNFEPTEISKYFADCIIETEVELEKTGVTLKLQDELAGSRYVVIDRERIKRAIVNILENARKYIDKSQGKITIFLRETTRSIVVEIQDNGAGIAENDLQKIFDRFYRTDTARSNNNGTGLGLAISKQIIEDHGGKTWAQSQLGKGTSILISLNKVSQPEGGYNHEKDIDC